MLLLKSYITTIWKTVVCLLISEMTNRFPKVVTFLLVPGYLF